MNKLTDDEDDTPPTPQQILDTIDRRKNAYEQRERLYMRRAQFWCVLVIVLSVVFVWLQMAHPEWWSAAQLAMIPMFFFAITNYGIYAGRAIESRHLKVEITKAFLALAEFVHNYGELDRRNRQ
jgi:hypothetical protein